MVKYFKQDVAEKIKEKTARRVQTWADEKYVIPDIIPSSGRGTTRVFSEKNVIEFAMLKILKDHENLPLEYIKIILDGLRRGESEKSDLFGNKLNFKDFYTNPAWGVSKELLFVSCGLYGARDFRIIEKNGREYYNNVDFSGVIDYGWRLFTVIMLGRTKLDALKLLNS